IGEIVINLVPVIVIAALIVAGLWFAPSKMIAGFNVFGAGVTIVITALTAIAVFQQITGIMLPWFDVMATADESGMTPLNSGLLTCGQIGIVLIGAFPMVKWITKTFGGALEKVGKALGINETSSAGMVANLANNIAMFNIMGDMDPKGKLLNVAFSVSAAFVIGDHLGFTAGVDQSMVTPVMIGKLVGGITAILVANILAPKLLAKIDASKK
ncbi:MAG: ethanolamine utilization protein EutH, partial [Butyricicoccus sp.]|nr:ethanolamine utilization protein EutH [Butyricicoccus sp.]